MATIAADRYANALAMQVRTPHVIDMTDAAARALVEQERPNLIVPRSRPLPDALVKIEEDGLTHR